MLAAFIWGSAFVAQSAGMDYIEPFTYNGIRTLLGGIVLLPLIMILDRKNQKGIKHRENNDQTIQRNTVIGGVVCGVLLCIASSFQQFGISMTTAGKAGFITALYVIMVPIIGLFIGKKVNKIIWLCVAMAIAGFYLLTMSGSLSLGTGDLLVLVCAFVFSFHIMAIDYFTGKGVDPVRLSCLQFFVAGILMLILMVIFEEPVWEMIVAARWSILYAGVLSCGAGYTLQIIGQQDTDPTLATLIMSLESVFSVISGWLILGEVMSGKEILGCVLVFASVVLAQLRS